MYVIVTSIQPINVAKIPIADAIVERGLTYVRHPTTRRYALMMIHNRKNKELNCGKLNVRRRDDGLMMAD